MSLGGSGDTEAACPADGSPLSGHPAIGSAEASAGSWPWEKRPSLPAGRILPWRLWA